MYTVFRWYNKRKTLQTHLFELSISEDIRKDSRMSLYPENVHIPSYTVYPHTSADHAVTGLRQERNPIASLKLGALVF